MVTTNLHFNCSVGIDEEEAKRMDSFICEFCSFEDPNGSCDLFVSFRRRR